MFKILGIIFLVMLFLFLLVVMMFASAVLSFIRKFRNMGNYRNPETNRSDRDYTGRQQQQYSYRNHAGSSHGYSSQQGRSQSSSASSPHDETIVDMRSPRQSGKKIFGDDEGEYVDFVEEKG